MNWEKLDPNILNSLRERFLSPSHSFSDYWTSEEVLEHYDQTFGERIGWKWDGVLREIKDRGIDSLDYDWILDWGCGTGQALRAVLRHFEISHSTELFCLDRSPIAVRWLQRKFPNIKAVTEVPTEGKGLVLLSHVQSEISPSQQKKLEKSLLDVHAILWVEPGTFESSHALIEIRERLRERFHVVAPCPHQVECGLRANKKDWCHHFAPVPSLVFQDRGWRKWSESLKIDLRSLPYSFLFLTKPPQVKNEIDRKMIGRPRDYKGYRMAFYCDSSGVRETKELTKKPSA